jgi:hypothetical protein
MMSAKYRSITLLARSLWILFTCLEAVLLIQHVNTSISSTNNTIYHSKIHIYGGGARNLLESAFCQPVDGFDSQRNFPIPFPESHIPWVWDAVYDPVKEIVELTTISNSPCRFRHDQWMELLHMFPDNRDQLAYGKSSNILVPADAYVTVNDETYIIHSILTCEYLDYNHKIVSSTKSWRVRGIVPFASLGTLQIRCPTPKDIPKSSWQSIRIRLDKKRERRKTQIYSEVTTDVPVCTTPRYDPSRKQFKLAICTATNRPDRKNLVEWIEYHRLVGVEHFYIYDTNRSNRTALRMNLLDYIDEGIVTVVPWYYANCVRNLAGGRWTVYRVDGNPRFFQSPRAIAQAAALGSCYSRFKHTSKYMIHVDDDEFLAFSGQRLETNSSGSLYDVAEVVFESNPAAAAVRFEPVLFWPCNTTGNIERLPHNAIEAPNHNIRHVERPSPLPRLGVWDLSWRYEKHEAKLLMRTDAVGMFFVHYISLIEPGWESSPERTTVTLDLMQGAVFHYKYPASLANTLSDGQLPFTEHAFNDECHYYKGNANVGKTYHAQVPYAIVTALKERYQIRMADSKSK